MVRQMASLSSPKVFPFKQNVPPIITRYYEPARDLVVQIEQVNEVESKWLKLNEIVKAKSLDQLADHGGVEGISASLRTDPQKGISGDPDDITARKKSFGANTFIKQPTKTLFPFIVEALKNPTNLILLACAALSLGFGMKEHGPKEGCYEGGSIFVTIFVLIYVSAICGFKQNREFEKLSNEGQKLFIDVVRNGRRQKIFQFDIVVGDIVCLNIGDRVPADGLFIGGHSLQVYEYSMRGEINLVGIDGHQNPFLIAGTKVVDGYAKMLVTSVGMSTSWGERLRMINRSSDEQTPLQARLNKLTWLIATVGLGIAFLVLVVLLVHYFRGNTQDGKGNKEFNGSKTKFDDIINVVGGIITFVVPIVIVAIPVGLPLAGKLTLAYSMKSMRADQAVVRKLSACETMGSATVICTSKTGTLTLNRMKVTKFWQGKEPMEGRSHSLIAGNVLEFLHHNACLNRTGDIYNSGSNFEISGDPTEKAIFSWSVRDLNMDMEAVKRNCVILHAEVYNSERKRSGILMKKVEDNTIHVHWKGAAEMILVMCSHYYDLEGNMKVMDNQERMEFYHIIEGMAASSLRCMAFAHKQVSGINEDQSHKKIQEEGLILLGLVGLKDPCRPGVKKAIEDCQYAGLDIKMITGDDITTAKTTAVECGILHSDQEPNNGSVVEGVDFRNYSEEERMDKVENIYVMARSSPNDKLLLIGALRKKGQVVAVAGDGTNDAPALVEADIGLSMGIQGTEVAKESSDIIILDGDFSCVVKLVRWGRCVHDNIQKFIQFQLTVNVAALTINFVAAVSAGEVPLTAVQLLWVNLIMVTLGALTLAAEKPTKELMEKRPVGRTEPLISNIMWRNLLAQALYQIVVLLIMQFKGESILGISEKVNDTLIFNTFVLCQVFNVFNARKLEKKNIFEGIHRNKLFLGIIGITILLQVLMVEFLKKFADTERLNWVQWGLCIAGAAASWLIGSLVKFIPVPEKPFFSYLN